MLVVSKSLGWLGFSKKSELRLVHYSETTWKMLKASPKPCVTKSFKNYFLLSSLKRGIKNHNDTKPR